MNDHSIFQPQPWQRFNQDLGEIYQAMIDHYHINTAGEIVTEFTDKGTVHSYIDFYQQQFAPCRMHTRLLEIGMMTGASMKLWTEYFCVYQLVGIDLRAGWNNPQPWQTDLEQDPNVELHFGIDSTCQQVEFDEPFTIIIDDGAHDWQSQMLTFRNYWPQLAPGGVYYIEDVEDARSLALLRQAIPAWLGPDVTIGMDQYLGHRHGRQDDQILIIKKSK